MNSNIKEIDINNIEDVDENNRFRNSDGSVFNDAYESLRESIVNTKGRYLLFDVYETEHMPGRYKIFKGGSTRLAIAKELSEMYEADAVENPYKSVRCVISPKEPQHKILLLGVGENITRGELCYGEKAMAMDSVVRAFQMETEYEAENEIEMFLQYVKSNGLDGLVNSTRNYYYLQKTAEVFVYPNVLRKRIIEGRAKATWIREALALRGKYLSAYVEENGKGQEGQAIDLFNLMCEECDDVGLEIGLFKSKIQELMACIKEGDTGTTETDADYATKFDKVYDLKAGDISDKLNDDAVRNAIMFTGEIVRTGTIERNKKKSYRLGMMDIRHKEIGGFVDLIRLLPKDAKKLALKELFG